MRPSLLTMLAFCKSKPADEAYPFMDACRCACAQFSHSMGMVEDKWWTTFDGNMSTWIRLNTIARDEPRTFGSLAERLQSEMNKYEVIYDGARMAQIGEPMRRYEVIPIHTPPVETPVEPKAPVVNPEKVEPEKVE